MREVSVCIIAKNEEKNIENCLKPFSAFPVELVLVDTGSTDRTVEIAQKYTDRIFSFAWQEDFAAARNFSLSCASHDWVLIVDCDEYMTELDWNMLAKAIKDYPAAVGMIKRLSPDKQGHLCVDEVPRFFDRRLFHYERPVHEQVVANSGKPFQVYPLSATFHHVGYQGSAAEIFAKFDRDRTILEKQLQTDAQDPYLYFQLGQGYFMIQDYTKAQDYFAKGLSFPLDPDIEYVQMMVVYYGHCLNNAKKFTESVAFLENLAPYFQDYADFAYVLGLSYLAAANYMKAVLEFIHATSLTHYKQEGTNSFLAFYQLGLIYEAMGDSALSTSFYEKALPYPPAAAKLETPH